MSEIETTKKPKLQLTGVGKLVLILMGIVILMPFVGIALAVVMGLVIAGIALSLGLVAGLIAVLVALLAAILHAMGVVIPWPVTPWL